MDELNLDSCIELFNQIHEQCHKEIGDSCELVFYHDRGKRQVVKKDCNNLEHLQNFLQSVFNCTSSVAHSYEYIPNMQGDDTVKFDCDVKFINFSDRRKSVKSVRINLTITHKLASRIYEEYNISESAA